jgi:hypothetical protein
MTAPPLFHPAFPVTNLDPCGNALEFKAFHDMGQVFAR